MGKRRLLFGGLSGILIFLFLANTKVLADVSSNSSSDPSILISEVKLGGGDDIALPNGSTTKQYVTLYNQSQQSVDLTGWTLEYTKIGFDSSFCGDNWAQKGTLSSVKSISLSGNLESLTASSPVDFSFNDEQSGSLRLVSGDSVVEDLVGWGQDSPCAESSPSSTPKNGTSLLRYLDCTDQAPIDTNDNSADFASNQIPSPRQLGAPINPDCSSDSPGGLGGGSSGAVSCEGVLLSEVLPNPEGSDAYNEFVELYNPTNKAINLEGCFLHLESSNSKYYFGNQSLGPGEYKSFYDKETSLTLPNSSGEKVWLVSAKNVELSQMEYPGGLADDQSWEFANGSWQKSYQPTPNGKNVILGSLPCPAGQIRNPSTSRCINTVTVASSLSPCEPGKKRSPETNRCRNMVSLASALSACGLGQVRNPETNRCRKIGESASSLKHCAPNQQRNPETNRCRKVLGASGATDSSNFSKVKDVPSANISKSFSWWFAGLAIIGVVGYAVFEWRGEFTAFARRFKGTTKPSSLP